MEEKYTQFLQYDWNNQKWKDYFNQNCYIEPPVTTTKILRARKKFYKLHVDPDFDINYTTPAENKLIEHEESHHNPSACDHSQQLPPRMGILEQCVAAIEGFLWVCYFFNMLIVNYILRICLIALFVRFMRINFKNFSKDFLKRGVLKDELFHLMIYSCILMTDRINYLSLFPFTLTALYSICDYFGTHLRIFQFTKKYFNKVTDEKERLEQLRGFALILVGIWYFFGVIIGWNGVLFVALYGIFLGFLYEHNSNVQSSCHRIHEFMKRVSDSERSPGFVKWILRKIIGIFSYWK